MANEVLGATVVAQATGTTVGAELFNEAVLKASPVLKTLSNRKVIAGQTYKGMVRTNSIPGGFRTLNSGVAAGGSDFRPVTSTLAIYSVPVVIDVAAAKVISGTIIEDVLATESQSGAEGLLNGVDYACFNTVSNGSSTFLSLTDASMKQSATPEADSEAVENSLAVFVKASEILTVFGGDDNITMGEWKTQMIDDGTGKQFMAWVNSIDAVVNFVPQNKYALACLVNLNDDNVFDDGQVAKMVSECRGQPYSHIFVNRKAVYQLQQSRKTALMPTPDWPTESMGIPLVVTDNIPSDLAFIDVEESSDSST